MNETNIYVIVPVFKFDENHLEWFSNENKFLFDLENVFVFLKLNGQVYEGEHPRLLIHSQFDNSIYEAWNQSINAIMAIEREKSFYTIFCGIDDSLNPDFFMKALIKTRSKPDIIFGNIDIGIGHKIVKKLANPGSTMLDETRLKSWDIFHPGMFMNSTLFNLCAFDETYQLAADFKFFAEISLKKPLKKHFVNLSQATINLDGISNKPEARAVYFKELKRIESDLQIKVSGFIKVVEHAKLILLKTGVGRIFRKLYWAAK